MLPIIPHDKALHISYGAAVALVGAVIAFAIGQPLWLGALALAALFAVGKEVYDRASRKGTPDALAGVPGILRVEGKGPRQWLTQP